MGSDKHYKRIGKISHISVGYGGYQDAMFGVSFTLAFKGSGCGDFLGSWGLAISSRGAKWTEKDRDKTYASTMRKLDQLCLDADVRSVNELQGKPIEATFDSEYGSASLVSWRILTEAV